MARTKNEIIAELETNGIMDGIVANITKTTKENDDTIEDLKQMAYLALLEKDDDEIIGMYERGQLLFFVARILTNNWHSSTSKFYYLYKKLMNNSTTLDGYDGDNDEE